MDALRAAGLEDEVAPTPSRRGDRSSASASACRCCSTAARRTRTRRASASSPARSRWLPAELKRPQMQWNQLAVSASTPTTRCSPGSASRRGCTSCTRCTACRPTRRRWPPRASTAASSTRRSGATTCSPPSSTRRSRANRASRCSPTSSRLAGSVRGMTAELYPAIDLRGGRVVRLLQGDYDQRDRSTATTPSPSPRSFADQGATWIHVVDLDAARSGSPENRHVVAAIAARRARSRQVQTGGGVRTVADAEVLADAGVARVVMGSAAVRDPQLVADASRDRRRRRRPRPPRRRARRARVDRGERRAAVRRARLVPRPQRRSSITDIGRDGMLQGPDVEGLAPRRVRPASR